MSTRKEERHPLASERIRLGWTQAQLAERAGIPRTTVGAIESGRLTPSVTSALSLARALGRSVESLFSSESAGGEWAIDPGADSRFFLACVGERLLGYPADRLRNHSFFHDGLAADAILAKSPTADFLPEDTLVIACCDPASGLLAGQLARVAGIRLLVLERGGAAALDLLRRGLVHAAGLHFSTPENPERNRDIVAEKLGAGFQLVRVAAWEEGLAVPATDARRSITSLKRGRFPWALREAGSAARECFDTFVGGGGSDADRLVPGHAAVAASVRDGWAGGGVCVRLCAEEAGLEFRSLREEFLDFCFHQASLSDHRIQALLNLIRSREYRRLVSDLPGYDTRETGELLPA